MDIDKPTVIQEIRERGGSVRLNRAAELAGVLSGELKIELAGRWIPRRPGLLDGADREAKLKSLM